MTTETVTIPRAEYEALLSNNEDFLDMVEAAAILARVDAGEETFPAALVDRLINGEHPLTVFREHRGMSKVVLAQTSGVNRVQITDIEAGRAAGSVATLSKLADALGVDVDDLIP
jgi:DNA-binding XRE family transcriptional regulator